MRKFLLSILVSIIWLVSFWYCYISIPTSISLPWWETIDVVKWDCFRWQNSSAWWNLSLYLSDGTLVHTSIWFNNTSMMCATDTWYVYNKSSTAIWLYYYNVQELIICPSCTNYTSEECQQEYSLMPINSCNSEYCWLNWLCPENTGDVMSQLYINGIEHLSAPMINITIPMEIQRNYEYTWVNEDIFDLDIWSQQGDENYIQWIIDVNSYRPTSEDFTQTFVWWLMLIFPYIIITAVILFIWRFIRKIFK